MQDDTIAFFPRTHSNRDLPAAGWSLASATALCTVVAAAGLLAGSRAGSRAAAAGAVGLGAVPAALLKMPAFA